MAMRVLNVDWCNLREDYARLGSCRAVAKEYGVHHDTVRYHMKLEGLERSFDLTKTGGASQLGRECELFVLSMLEGAEDVASTDPQAPYDILYQGKRINVKRSGLKTTLARPFWGFRATRSDQRKCDYFACVAYKDGKPLFMLMVPSSVVPKEGVTVVKSRKSKYMQYLQWENEVEGDE